LNWLYSVAGIEMTLALLAVGLDAGIAMFHVDMDRRPSLALDGIEAVRPHIDHWLLAYLSSTVFANRDFTELRDGEVRLTHPLIHIAHTAALWHRVSDPVASWLKLSFNRVSEMRAYAQPWPNLVPPSPRAGGRPRAKPAPQPVLSLAPLLPALPSSAPPVQAAASLRGGLRDDPVPRMCRECGRALPRGHRTFCSRDCGTVYHRTGNRSSQHPAE
jgi:hypothetical protein